MTDDEIRAAVEAGDSDEQLAEKMGMSVRTAKRHRQRLRLLKPPGSPPADRDYIQRMFDEKISRHARSGNKKEVGLAISEIARDMGMNPYSLRRVLRDDLGLLENDHHRTYSDEQYAEGKRLLDQGMPYLEAAKLCGVSSWSLAQKFPGMGLAKQDIWVYSRAKELAKKLGLEV